MAEACAKTGRMEEARRVVSEALTAIEHNGIRYYEAELNRLEGELRLRLDAQQAEVCFCRAIEIARAQHAKSLELRAAISLARLWRDQASAPKPAISSRRSTAGSPKVSTRRSCKRPRYYSTN